MMHDHISISKILTDSKMMTVIPQFAMSGLQLAGPFFAVALQAAALDTARKIFDKKSTGSLSALPFISLFTNCLIWTYYGFLVNNMSVLVPNGIGVLAGFASTMIFQMFAVHAPFKEYSVAAAALCPATYFFLQSRSHEVGLIGCALSVLLMSSPLATFETVLKTKSTDSLPLGTSLVTAGNAVSWTLYGFLVANDPMIFVPSALGLLPAAVQLGLYAKYGLPTVSPKLYEREAKISACQLSSTEENGHLF